MHTVPPYSNRIIVGNQHLPFARREPDTCRMQMMIALIARSDNFPRERIFVSFEELGLGASGSAETSNRRRNRPPLKHQLCLAHVSLPVPSSGRFGASRHAALPIMPLRPSTILVEYATAACMFRSLTFLEPSYMSRPVMRLRGVGPLERCIVSCYLS